MNFFHKLATLVGFAFLPVLVISDTNIHLAKESYESSQQRDLQAPPEADTCFTVHFTTSTLRYSKSIGGFHIMGYGMVPLECQENGAECDITICGINTLDIDTSSRKMWRFSITGDIGPLVNHKDHPTSGKEFLAGFPTQMGKRASIFQSYQLVKAPTKAQEWIDTDPFTSLDGIIMEERLALANLYFATNGEGWFRQDAWMTGIDHCDWEDVSCNNSDGYVTFLNLYENQLTGPIPQSIGNLDNLLRLDLHENRLTGPIPQSIGNLVNLKKLCLSFNELTGPVPETIGNLVNLRALLLVGDEQLDPTPEWLTTFCKGRRPGCFF